MSYAHHVIESLSLQAEAASKVLARFPLYPDIDMLNKMIKAAELIPAIKLSQKFHFNAEELWASVAPASEKHNVEAAIHIDPLSRFPESLRLPYPITWLDWCDWDKTPIGDPFQSLSVNHPVHQYLSAVARVAGVTQKDIPTKKMALLIIEDPKFKKWHIFPLEHCHGFWFQNSYKIVLNVKTSYPNYIIIKTINNKRGFPPDHPDSDDYLPCYNAELIILEYFLALLHCQNIEEVKHMPPKRLNKKRAKKGKTPLFEYHTLHIKPLNKKTRSLGQADPTDIHMRVHLQRGHFKKYTADNPLFGKITGLWWWQPHVRGRNKKGVVMNDYELDCKSGD